MDLHEKLTYWTTFKTLIIEYLHFIASDFQLALDKRLRYFHYNDFCQHSCGTDQQRYMYVPSASRIMPGRAMYY